MLNLKRKNLILCSNGILLAIVFSILFCLYEILMYHHHRRIPINHKIAKVLHGKALHGKALHGSFSRRQITEALSEITPMDQPQHPSPPPELMNQTHIWGLPMEPVNDIYPGNIYFSVKTTHHYYSTRLLDLLLTWCQAVDKGKVIIALQYGFALQRRGTPIYSVLWSST